jgi:hypothetical protein
MGLALELVTVYWNCVWPQTIGDSDGQHHTVVEFVPVFGIARGIDDLVLVTPSQSGGWSASFSQADVRAEPSETLGL